jgi:hypothetical protein
MHLDPKIDVAKAAIITLAGKEYFVPMLALRQLRTVVPGLAKLLPVLNEARGRLSAGDWAGALNTEDVDIVVDIICTALTRAYLDVTVDDILDLDASFGELFAAIAVVAKQTGLFVAAPSGEAQGAETTPPILTESSAGIANIPASPGLTP